MQTLIIQEILCLEPMYLNSNIKNHILEKLKIKFINTCTKRYGYIFKVNRIIEFFDNSISSACHGTNFNITFEIDTLKPEINKIFSGIVCMVISKGIFINIYDKMKVLVPLDKMNGYIYDQSSNSYTKNTNNSIIGLNSIVSVKIIGIKYSKKEFSCFSELISVI